jgi:hypothetical protein
MTNIATQIADGVERSRDELYDQLIDALVRWMSAARVTSAWTEACPSSSARALAPSPFRSARATIARRRAPCVERMPHQCHSQRP